MWVEVEQDCLVKLERVSAKVKKRLNSEQQEKKEIFVDERSSSDKKRKFDSEERVSSALSEFDLQNLGHIFIRTKSPRIFP